MTQSPVTVTYTLEEVLGQLNQKLDRIDTKVENLGKEVDHKFENLRNDVDIKFNHLQVSQVRVEGEIQAIGKRLDSQDFFNRSVMVGLVLAVLAGILKIFFPGLIS